MHGGRACPPLPDSQRLEVADAKSTRVLRRTDPTSSISVRISAKNIHSGINRDTYVWVLRWFHTFKHEHVCMHCLRSHTQMGQLQSIWCHFQMHFVCTRMGDDWQREWQQQVSWTMFATVCLCVGALVDVCHLRSKRIFSCTHIIA